MYDRYTISSNRETLASKFQIEIPDDYLPNYNASPANLLPIVTSSTPGKAELSRWGFMSNLSNNKTISPKLFNLPLASAYDRHPYRKALEKNRCVILADGFFGWKRMSKKQKIPHYFYLTDREPFGIAGIWETAEDLNGKVNSSFNMIIADASESVRSFQEDMPLILNQIEITRWLDQHRDVESLREEINSMPPKNLLYHPVSPGISDQKRNSPKLIEPAPPSDQHGNYTLFG